MKLDATGVLAIAGVGVAAYLGYRVYKGAGTVAQKVAQVVKTDLNPTNSQNIANRAFEAVQAPVTGQASFSDFLLKTFNPAGWEALQNRPTELTVRAGPAPDTGDETARLLARYPVPQPTREPSSMFDTGGSFGDGAGLPSYGFGGLWTQGPGYFTGIPTFGGS